VGALTGCRGRFGIEDAEHHFGAARKMRPAKPGSHRVEHKDQDRAGKIARALGGSSVPDASGNYLCRCPVHGDQRPSLSICDRDGKLLLHCFAGCSYSDLIAALKRLTLLPGKSGPGAPVAAPAQPARPPSDPLKMWREASPRVAGSPVEAGLRNRGRDLPADAPLRYASSLWHWPTRTRRQAMIALVQRYDGAPITSHATFLSRDGRKAPVNPARLFAAGVSPAGGGVWFNGLGGNPELIVAEGIESALSAALLYDAEACVATLSTHGMRTLVLSPSTRRPVRIFADHDLAGHGLEAARDLYRRLRSENREAIVTLPDNVGEDANDILLRRLRVRA
jgi:hypothetical protein